MRRAVKNIYDASPFYLHCRKHFCPQCGKRLELKFSSKIVNSKSEEAKNFDFSVGDTFYIGDVEFRMRYFHCEECKMDISVKEMKEHEKHKK